ncbi:Arc family DNA-binding protein [Azospirillum sp. YIM DDC1]|uniref:Arc family DNA-binding protein n=1 Tax=Azospirillum aestuarii TaxID=2802052 RepID=A0ABS1I7J2_9PROT|nr:Arc family DNA-binding protein [Azospirillum aestuarii]MBK4723039.1 Arc family DNA-binding protein [Azospirillum aestuarii]
MAEAKTDKMMIRFRPEVRALLAKLAEDDSRSMAGELEWLIRQEAKRRGLGNLS